MMRHLHKRLPYVVFAVLIAASLGGYALAQGDVTTTPEPTAAPTVESDSAKPSGYLGIYFDMADDGVLVTNIEPNSPASTAGLQAGDIITAIDGEAVTVETISATIAAYNVGDEITLTVKRGEETLKLQVTLAARPEVLTVTPPPVLPSRPMLGVTLEESDNGPRITRVLEGSPAAEIGLKVGDVIKTINGVTVKTVAEAIDVVSAQTANAQIKLVVERDGKTLEFDAVLRDVMGGFSGRRFEMSPDGFLRSMIDGVSFEYLNDEEAWNVVEIDESSPFFEAGLRLGDKITAIEGEKPTLGAFPMGRNFRFGGVGDTVTLTVVRGEETLEIEAPATIWPALMVNMFGMRGIPDPELFDFRIVPPQIPDSGNGRIFPFPFMQPQGARLGVAFIMLDEQSAAEYGVTVTEGALITAVEEVSPANNAGLKPKDVIVSVDGEALSVQRTLRDVIASKSPGDVVVLSVVRGEETLEISVTLGQPEQFSRILPVPTPDPFADAFSL